MPDPTPAESADKTVAVEPLEVDGVRTAVVGTGAWLAALVVMLLLRGQLTDDGNGWWIGVAVAGLVLGLIGIAFLLRRRAVYRRGSTSSPSTSPASPSPQES